MSKISAPLPLSPVKTAHGADEQVLREEAMRPGVEILRLAAEGSPEDSPLRQILCEVQRLEVMLTDLDEEWSRTRMSTMIDYLIYQATHITDEADLGFMQHMTAQFRGLLEYEMSRSDHKMISGWLGDDMREVVPKP